MGDWFSEKFSDLDYPGRRKPINRTPPMSSSNADAGWDDRPLVYKVAGMDVQFFTIGHLAKALGYSVESIRAWENNRLLPKSRYRTPNPKVANQPEHLRRGRRLWTREQIEGILRIASEEGVILNKKPPTTRFAVRVQALFNEIHESTSQ